MGVVPVQFGKISVTDLLEGMVTDLCRTLPVVGQRAAQVVLRKPAELDGDILEGVTDLIAFAPFRCRESVPNVRGLYLSYDATIDEATARCFPGLINLRAETKQPISLSWFDNAPLEGLSLSDDSIEPWRDIGRTSLHSVRLLWGGKQPLSALPLTVRRLTIGGWPHVPAKMIAPVAELPELESLALYNMSLPSLHPLAKTRRLVDLAVSVKSLKGLEALDLRSLLLISASSCPTLAGLGASKSLSALEVRARRPPSDLAEIGRVETLERLSLVFGYLNDVVEVSSIGFLRSLGRLTDLSIATVRLRDGDVGPIQGLRRLKRVKLVGDFGPMVRGLGAALRRRGAKVDVHAIAPPKHKAIATPKRLDGAWTIFEDLAGPLKRRDNYKVEAEVKRALKNAAPGVIERIEFDSEKDSFSAVASSRKDIDLVSEIVRNLAHANGSGSQRRR